LLGRVNAKLPQWSEDVAVVALQPLPQTGDANHMELAWTRCNGPLPLAVAAMIAGRPCGQLQQGIFDRRFKDPAE